MRRTTIDQRLGWYINQGSTMDRNYGRAISEKAFDSGPRDIGTGIPQYAGPVWTQVAKLHDAATVLDAEIDGLLKQLEGAAQRLQGVLRPYPQAPDGTGPGRDDNANTVRPATSKLTEDLERIDTRLLTLAQRLRGVQANVGMLIERVEV